MTVSPSAFFSLWMAIAMGLSAAIALADAWRDRRRPGRRAKLYHCGECGRVYEDRRNVPLSPCPRCGALNEAARR